jgi:hypothetical protein
MTRGWTPGWQEDARDVLTGTATVDEVAARQAQDSRRPGAARERNAIVLDEQTAPYEPEQPMLYGRQEMADTSTCTDLVRLPGVIWDVNGYYRALGISFPHREPTTKSGLRQAHRAAGGLDDRWKTYALKQLKDEAVRAVYDAMPLGQPYIDDYWNEFFDNEAKKEALRKVASGEVELDEAITKENIDKIKKEWGIELDAEPENETPAAPAAKAPTTVHLTWSYYLWRCDYASTVRHQARLDTWRTMLVEAFRDRRMRLTFRVGFFGKQPHPWIQLEREGHLILLLNKDQEPTREYAAQAAARTQREWAHTDTVMMIEENRNAIASRIQGR